MEIEIKVKAKVKNKDIDERIKINNYKIYKCLSKVEGQFKINK